MSVMDMSLTPRLRLTLESPYQGALRLYEDSEKVNVDVPWGRKKLSVSAALVKEDDLSRILDGEKYGGAIGGMFFITEKVPEEYKTFCAVHLMAEHAAPRGFDVTGLAEHYQAIVVELGYAKHILTPEEFGEYFEWRKEIERTDFFKLKDNRLTDRIAERMGEIFESMPKHLTYRNKKLIQEVRDDTD